LIAGRGSEPTTFGFSARRAISEKKLIPQQKKWIHESRKKEQVHLLKDFILK
jgi:hypothetical protein